MAMMVLDLFNGTDNLEDWISRAERYFTFLGFLEEHWLPLPSYYIDGDALEWFRWMFRNNQLFNWKHFSENSLNPVDNVEGPRELPDTFIDEHSSHVDNMFDEISIGVFTKEVKKTSSDAILLGDLDNIQSTRVLDESVHNCCHKVVTEVQPDTPIKMLDEESLCLERNKFPLFDECSPRNMSKSVDVHGAAMNLCVWDPAHLRGHRRVEECTVAQQVLKSNTVFKALHHVLAIQIKFSSHNDIFVEIQFAKLGKTYGINDAYDSPNIKKVMNIVGLSKAEKVTIFRILASVMMLSNMDLAKGNEIVSSILHVDNAWFYLCTTIAAFYTHLNLERFNIILSMWLHSNLEGKVLIGERGIVMNGPKPVMVNYLEYVPHGQELKSEAKKSKLPHNAIFVNAEKDRESTSSTLLQGAEPCC
ncbi:hypothetical protein BC332_11767 [Capsicum chinense]|nr:hypothetical protein BC332_11767 [Capsicum chinense]